MEIINDKALLERFLKEHQIEACFSSGRPRFLLLRYRPGELLTTPFTPSEYLQFIIRGEVLLYDMPRGFFSLLHKNNGQDSGGESDMCQRKAGPHSLY